MKKRPNLNELAKEIHNDNKLKGFHDVDWSNEHCLMLAICELCEAIEADRKGKKEISKEDIDKMEYITTFHPNNTKLFIYAYQNRIKGSTEEELADFVICLLDLAGKKKQEVTLYDNNVANSFKYYMSEKKGFAERIYFITNEVMHYYKYEYPYTIGMINNSISCVEYLCNDMNIDLWLHVSLKLKYNKTRPYKHGKEY